VGLCFSCFCFLGSGCLRVGGGMPIFSLAAAFTAVTARNVLRLRFRATAPPEGDYAIIFGLGAEPPGAFTETGMEEKDFFEEREQRKAATLMCPHCRQSADYELAWLVRTKKRQLPPRADERDRAKFAKARSYMVRREDLVACKNVRCRKRFEVSGVQSVAFLD